MSDVNHITTTKVGDSTDANFPKDGEGRVYHVGTKRGEVANRILTVGDPERAIKYSKLIDVHFERTSNRGFKTITGTYKSVPVSIVSIGMGPSMMDFMVRECMHVVDGPMAIIRIGTCGTPSYEVPVGSVVVAQNSHKININYDAFRDESSGDSLYSISKPVDSDVHLSTLFKNKLDDALEENSVYVGTDLTADSFYSSQGRTDPNFKDENEDLIDTVMNEVPNAMSLQMETFELFHLAKISVNEIKAASCAIVLAQRKSNEFLSLKRKYSIEEKCGICALDALVDCELTSEIPVEEFVWNLTNNE